MTFSTVIGFVIVASIIAAGVYWVLENVTFERQEDRYSYMRDKSGNEYVHDNSKDAETG